MWQRDPRHPERLDPAHVYDHSPNEWGAGIDPEKGSGDAASGEPFWGFGSPLEPWLVHARIEPVRSELVQAEQVRLGCDAAAPLRDQLTACVRVHERDGRHFGARLCR